MDSHTWSQVEVLKTFYYLNICHLKTIHHTAFLSFCFLAHLSTKCSGWAIVIGLCPSSVVVRKLFSSPEHEVLKWAFVILQCPASVVRPSVRASTISLNNISSETAHWILTKLHRNDPWVVPYQSCSNSSSWLHK